MDTLKVSRNARGYGALLNAVSTLVSRVGVSRPAPAHGRELTERPESTPQTVARESAGLATHATVHRLVQSLLPNGGRVLDVPCGSGAFLRRIMPGPYEAVGGDIAPHPAARTAPFVQLDMDSGLPWATDSADAVVSIEGIEHIRRPFDFVRECRRVLRPGGVLLLTTPNISSLRSRWRCFLTGFHNNGKYPLDEAHPAPRHHVNLRTFPDWRYMLHTQGFRIETLTTNRVKAINLVYLPLLPWLRILGRVNARRGAKSAAHAAVCRSVFDQLHSVPVALGDALIISARAV